MPKESVTVMTHHNACAGYVWAVLNEAPDFGAENTKLWRWGGEGEREVNAHPRGEGNINSTSKQHNAAFMSLSHPISDTSLHIETMQG